MKLNLNENHAFCIRDAEILRQTNVLKITSNIQYLWDSNAMNGKSFVN